MVDFSLFTLHLQEMDQICVDVKRPDTNEEQRTHQDKTDTDNTEEKLISSHKYPWKPWKHGRSRIRGEGDYLNEMNINYSNQLQSMCFEFVQTVCCV